MNLWGILSSSSSDFQCWPVSDKPLWSKTLSNIIFVSSKFFSPLRDLGRVLMLIKPKIMSFLYPFVCRWSPKCF